MSTLSHARKAIALRERYESMSVALRREHLFASDRAERHTIGRYQALEYLVADLSTIAASMRPAQVHAIVLHELHRLAEAKAAWLLNSIRLRKLHNINQLGEWTAEGAIAQIDEVVPELCALLLPWLAPDRRVHSRYFQVWKPLVPSVRADPLRAATRWTLAREHWYREVAILEYAEENVTPEQCYLGLDSLGRKGGPILLWALDRAEPTQVGEGDLLVSLLSGEAWLLEGRALRQVSTILQEQQGETPPGDTTAPTAALSRFADRYMLSLRIDAGPLPAAFVRSDPFFQVLAEQYLDTTPPHDLWKLALLCLGARGQEEAGIPELPLAWECNCRPDLVEVLSILQDMSDTVWDAGLACVSREVWDEYAGEYANPGEADRAFEAQCWNVECLRGFLGQQAFDDLLAIIG